MLRRALALQALLAALFGLALLLAPWAPLQRFWLDAQLRWAAPTQVPPGVLVFDIDDASLAALREELGPWPFGRDVYALVVDVLREAGARAVVIDLMLADPRPGDAALAQALQRPGAPVLLAASGVPPLRPPPLLDTAPPDHQRWAQITLPSGSLTGAQALRLGVITTPLDDDGVLRHWALWHAAPQGRWPLLPLAALQALGEPLALPADDKGRITPLLGQEPQVLPFYRLVRSAREGAMDDSALRAARGAVVFIGAGSLLGDRVMTPLGQSHGTVLMAQTYAAMRDGHGLRALAPSQQIGLLMLALLPALLALLRGRFNLGQWLRGAAVALLLLGLLMLLALGMKRWVDPSPALLALLVGGVLHGLWQGRVARREAERLRAERALAEQTAEAKARFLANVSQELRTPLSAVVGVAELLAQCELGATQQQQTRLLLNASRSLQRLVDELLDYSRLDLQRLHLQPSTVHLPGLLQELMLEQQDRAGDADVRCELQLADGLPQWVSVDGARLAQVLGTLVGNAIQFSPHGRVTLTAQPLSDGRVQFSVSDTGIGIAGSQLQRIFEPFARGHGQEQQLGGTGLGLAVSRELVRLMGGDIEVQSVPGAGSRFTFALGLPAVAALAQGDLRPDGEQGLPSGLTLLLAEADELNAALRIAQLEPLGVQVERAANGHLALALAQRLRFDLVLLNLQLPGLDGHRVARGIREHEAREGLPRTPILALSALDGAAEAQAGLESGCDELLNQPVSLRQLRKALQRWAPAQAGGVEAGVEPDSGAHASVDPHAPAPSSQRHAHAAVFLGRWGEAWVGVRTDPQRSRALLADLLECAQGIGDEALVEATQRLDEVIALPVLPLRKQVACEEAVHQAVAAALLALR